MSFSKQKPLVLSIIVLSLLVSWNLCVSTNAMSLGAFGQNQNAPFSSVGNYVERGRVVWKQDCDSMSSLSDLGMHFDINSNGTAVDAVTLTTATYHSASKSLKITSVNGRTELDLSPSSWGSSDFDFN